MPLSRFLIAVLAWGLPAVTYAGPREDVLRLVPDDYTFCVVAQNLRDTAAAAKESRPLERLANTPLLKMLRDSAEARKAAETAELVLRELGVSPVQLREDILGDVAVFAYRKGPPDKPEQEDGLFLVHARDPKLLAQLVERINEMQTKGGEIKGVEPADGYSRRLAPDGSVRDFFALDGSLLVYSTKEGLLRTTLAKRKAAETGEPAAAKRMIALGAADAPLVCLVNPRSFDADLAHGEKEAGGSEKAFVEQFRGFWSAVDGLALVVRIVPHIEVGLALNVRTADLSPAAARFFAEAQKLSPLWSKIPDDALFAAVGRVHAESLVALISTVLTGQDRVKVVGAITDAARPFLESDDLSPLVRGLGPDVGLWLTAPESSDRTWVPRATLAVKVAPTPEGKAAEAAALKGLDFLARLAALGNREVGVRSADGVTYLTSDSIFPPGFKPAFAAKGGYLVLAGSPEGIARFTPPAGEATTAEEVPLVRVSVRAWKDYLKTHGPAIAAYAADKKGNDAAALAGQLEAIGPLLEGFDKVELVQRSAPGRATLLLRLHLTK
jgi:hypothetical protein